MLHQTSFISPRTRPLNKCAVNKTSLEKQLGTEGGKNVQQCYLGYKLGCVPTQVVGYTLTKIRNQIVENSNAHTFCSRTITSTGY